MSKNRELWFAVAMEIPFVVCLHMIIRKLIVGLLSFFLLFIISCNHPQKSNEKSESNDSIDPVLERLDELNREIRTDSLNSDAFKERAIFYYENEEYNEALKDIVSALEIDSTKAEYFVVISDVYLGLGKLNLSVMALDKAIELDPDNTKAYLRMAENSIIFRDYKKALDYIDKVIQLNSLESKAYFLRGVIFLENKDTIRGIRNFQKAIDVNQDYLEAHYQLGMLYALKKNKLAIDYFNNVLNIEPENIEVLYYLAMFYQETDDYENALKIYESIESKEPGFYYATFNIGYIHLVFTKDFQTAIDYFTKTIEINPDYGEAYYNRGFSYELLKDVENSRSDYKKTLELLPNYDKAIDGLNRIDNYLLQQK
ncbi:MAG: tetratricopeptide repeat protein [Bacteroidales bacterium]